MNCNTNFCACPYADPLPARSMMFVKCAAPEPVCHNADVIVPAGQAHTKPCDDFGTVQPRLAEIQFPIQQYQSGFCPCEALEAGTLFPELLG